MHLTYRNVNVAFRGLVSVIHQGSLPLQTRPSRAGEVIQIIEPMTITYTHPRERVLFNQVRDGNVFFHLYEALWMLAGRNDVAPLTYYSSKYKEIVSDDGVTQHGAYGHRWRRWRGSVCCTWNQLNAICTNLKENPDCRRQVLSIWDANRDLGSLFKDLPCNTHAYFSVTDDKLNMTVCNRSNDMIWGMLGANVVHFSMLQEYMAAKIGVGVGVYNQFTNNLHVYTERWIPKMWLADRTLDYYAQQPVYGEFKKVGTVVPLVKDPEQFDKEVVEFVERNQRDTFAQSYNEPFLRDVAQPMCIAFHQYKNEDLDSALSTVRKVKSEDWRIAGSNWLKKRAVRRAAKESMK